MFPASTISTQAPARVLTILAGRCTYVINVKNM